MRLLVQPGDSTTLLIKGIDSAKKSIELTIFRFDRSDIERALKRAAKRGVFVQTLIARTNRGGEQTLRRLEMRLLEAGASVARAADDLLRYHDKIMIVDRRVLYLLAFNFTHLDIEHSRSFGVITSDRRLVQEAIRLLEADIKRQPYTPGFPRFVVSPANARKQLSRFIQGARKELLIYDIRLCDSTMIRLLESRARAGVEIRIIGRMTRRSEVLRIRRLSLMRLHARTIIRDRRLAFVGSQSLRKLELDSRREAGLIFTHPQSVSRLVRIFEEDWAYTEARHETGDQGAAPVDKAARKVAKAIAKDLPPVAPVLEDAVKGVVGNGEKVNFEQIEETVKDAVKEAVQEAVKNAVEEVIDGEEAVKPG